MIIKRWNKGQRRGLDCLLLGSNKSRCPLYNGQRILFISSSDTPKSSAVSNSQRRIKDKTWMKQICLIWSNYQSALPFAVLSLKALFPYGLLAVWFYEKALFLSIHKWHAGCCDIYSYSWVIHRALWVWPFHQEGHSWETGFEKNQLTLGHRRRRCDFFCFVYRFELQKCWTSQFSSWLIMTSLLKNAAEVGPSPTRSHHQKKHTHPGEGGRRSIAPLNRLRSHVAAVRRECLSRFKKNHSCQPWSNFRKMTVELSPCPASCYNLPRCKGTIQKCSCWREHVWLVQSLAAFVICEGRTAEKMSGPIFLDIVWKTLL